MGFLMFVYAEIDDSPEGKLIVVVVGMFGLRGLILSKKKSK